MKNLKFLGTVAEITLPPNNTFTGFTTITNDVLTSCTLLLAETTTATLKKETRLARLIFVPDYWKMLAEVNAQSCIPLGLEAITSFAELFFGTFRTTNNNLLETKAALVAPMKNTEVILRMKIDKVAQAFILREQMVWWVREVDKFIHGYAISEINALNIAADKDSGLDIYSLWGVPVKPPS